MGFACGLLGLASMPLLAKLASWQRPQSGNGAPCGTVLKQSECTFNTKGHERFFFLQCADLPEFGLFLACRWLGNKPGKVGRQGHQQARASPVHLGNSHKQQTAT